MTVAQKDSVQIDSGQCESPLGTLLIAWRGDRLLSLDFGDFQERFQRLLTRRYASTGRAVGSVPKSIQTALDSYFAGELAALDTLAVEYAGTEFENRVWRTLRTIPSGATVTYGQIATGLDRPKASRAVGRANSLNPVAIVVPCHRVIGTNRKLTGYAGGLQRKQWLLEHEQKHALK
ncbi:MAG: methylated-DNA--[protein]-cysteine S-methyltransferase [Acidobacteriota bacterium]